MKVLVIGNGGREHALCWKLSQSSLLKKLFIAPGNPGTAMHGENVLIPAEDISGLKAFALRESIDLTVVGTELPLTMGIADEFKKAGLRVFGPSKAAALLEGSKTFAKDLMRKYKIPTGFYKGFENHDQAVAYVEAHQGPFVVKADGLAAGKGVIICGSKDEAKESIRLIMRRKAFGSAGNRIIIEEFLEGEEASFLAITDGVNCVPLAPAQDHKAILDNDLGPNTGGMGAYSPTALITEDLEKEIMDTVMLPAVKAMEAEGRPYRGILYAGLMIKAGRPKVLEFNCRFGDPETQPILMRLEDDLLEVLSRCAEDGRGLDGVELNWSERSAVCVVMSSEGYPGEYVKGHEISGLKEASDLKDVMIFHAGTAIRDSRVVTSGGRVLGVTALGDDLRHAIERAYAAVNMITWKGAYFRHDIGVKGLRA